MNNQQPFLVKGYLALRRFVPSSWMVHPILWMQKTYNKVHYGDFNFARAINIEISAHCNRRCYYCPQSVDPTKPKFIEQKVWHKALERVSELDWKWGLEFHNYNEPLLNKNLEQFVRDAKQACPKAALRILSNGDLLTEKRVESLVEAGICYFSITRHPPYSEEWDKKIIALVEKYPQYIRSSTIESWGLSNRGGLVKPINQQDMSKGCRTCETGIPITLEGDYLFCCCDYHKTEKTGNVFNTSILEAWHNQKYLSARKSVRNGVPQLDICKACFNKA